MYSLPSANGVGADEAGEVQQAVIALQKQGIAKKEIDAAKNKLKRQCAFHSSFLRAETKVGGQIRILIQRAAKLRVLLPA